MEDIAGFTRLNFLIHGGVTLCMVGIIWFVQLVHYPLFKMVDPADFAAYEIAHSKRISPIVATLMIAELFTAVLLLYFHPPEIPVPAIWLGLALVILIWLSTFFLQVPQHNILSSGFYERAHQFLTNSNWIRTAAWSIRGGLMIWMLDAVLQRS